MTPLNLEFLRETLANARRALIAERTPAGHWVGELSSSALSTATAMFTLHLRKDSRDESLVRNGLRWLAENQNADGGWGDTVRSFSNISTTCLCWAALSLAADLPTDLLLPTEVPPVNRRLTNAEAWIRKEAGSLDPAILARTIADRYGKDRTFSVPILTMLALAGRLGPDPWKLIPQLPFELAALPFSFFQIIRLPVVSYALPALIAIGLVKHTLRPSWNPIARLLRMFMKKRTLRKLLAIQPSTGGYLEATPLTSFVAMSLIGAGEAESPVVANALEFLRNSVRPDGSWPIDTNLTTWVTTLAIQSLMKCDPSGGTACHWDGDRSEQEHAVPPLSTKQWLLNQQYRVVHPFTRAAPGGWAWTDLPGGVPDADDTPSALLALRLLGEPDDTVVSAASAGVTWLLDLQNRDGGIPTFCKGWTGLPFDRSSNDLTAHAIRAWAAWYEFLDAKMQKRIDSGIQRGLQFLKKSQRPDGSWAPLWFGNQHSAEVANLTYGTSRVLKLAEISKCSNILPELKRGAEWLLSTQNPDGGWGGRTGTPSSIEESAWALEGLAPLRALTHPGSLDECTSNGIGYLADATNRGTQFPASPHGFYFANLWYFEKLYPMIYTVNALTQWNTARRSDS